MNDFNFADYFMVRDSKLSPRAGNSFHKLKVMIPNRTSEEYIFIELLIQGVSAKSQIDSCNFKKGDVGFVQGNIINSNPEYTPFDISVVKVEKYTGKENVLNGLNYDEANQDIYKIVKGEKKLYTKSNGKKLADINYQDRNDSAKQILKEQERKDSATQIILEMD